MRAWQILAFAAAAAGHAMPRKEPLFPGSSHPLPPPTRPCRCPSVLCPNLLCRHLRLIASLPCSVQLDDPCQLLDAVAHAGPHGIVATAM
jgi:hypothetical protein